MCLTSAIEASFVHLKSKLECEVAQGKVVPVKHEVEKGYKSFCCMLSVLCPAAAPL